MIVKFGVWFVGNENVPGCLCYDGREMYLANVHSEALSYKETLESYYPDQAGKYKLCRFEIEE